MVTHTTMENSVVLILVCMFDGIPEYEGRKTERVGERDCF